MITLTYDSCNARLIALGQLCRSTIYRVRPFPVTAAKCASDHRSPCTQSPWPFQGQLRRTDYYNPVLEYSWLLRTIGRGGNNKFTEWSRGVGPVKRSLVVIIELVLKRPGQFNTEFILFECKIMIAKKRKRKETIISILIMEKDLDYTTDTSVNRHSNY